jgi:hypothetical protein
MPLRLWRALNDLEGTGDRPCGADLLAQAQAIPSPSPGRSLGADFWAGEDQPLLCSFHCLTRAGLHTQPTERATGLVKLRHSTRIHLLLPHAALAKCLCSLYHQDSPLSMTKVTLCPITQKARQPLPYSMARLTVFCLRLKPYSMRSSSLRIPTRPDPSLQGALAPDRAVGDKAPYHVPYHIAHGTDVHGHLFLRPASGRLSILGDSATPSRGMGQLTQGLS